MSSKLDKQVDRAIRNYKLSEFWRRNGWLVMFVVGLAIGALITLPTWLSVLLP